MQTIMIRIALVLCLLEWAFAFKIPIQKEIGGQVEGGKSIIVNVPVGNRQLPKDRTERTKLAGLTWQQAAQPQNQQLSEVTWQPQLADQIQNQTFFLSGQT